MGCFQSEMKESCHIFKNNPRKKCSRQIRGWGKFIYYDKGGGGMKILRGGSENF